MAGKNREIIEVIVKGAGKSKKKLGGVNASLTSMAKRAGLAAGAYFGARGLIEGFKALVTQGSKLQNVSVAFENMGRKAGLTTGALEKFRDATNNTVDDVTLMTKANNAMALGLVESDEQFAELLDTAQRLGAALGQDVVQSLDSLVTGMGRQSKLMLDNLGIMVDTNFAYEKYAETLGISASALDENERKIAFNTEAMFQAKKIVGEMGEEQITAKMKMEELRVTFSNLTADLGEALMPILTRYMEKLVDLGHAGADFIKRLEEDAWETNIRQLKEMGADVRELELAYATMEKNKAMKKLGEDANTLSTNLGDVETINENLVGLDKDRAVALQDVVDFELKMKELAKAAGMEGAELEDLKVTRFMIASGRMLNDEELAHNARIDLILEEAEKRDEALLSFDEKIEKLNDEIALRLQLQEMVEKEAALKESLAEPVDGEDDVDPVANLEALSDAQIEFNRQQEITLNAMLLKKKLTEKFIELYPVEAKALGLVTKKDNERMKGAKKWIGILDKISSEVKAKAIIEQRISQIKAIIDTASAIAEASPDPKAMAMAAAVGVTQIATIEKQKFATGANYITSGPEMIMVGDNPSGEELVQVTPLGGDPNLSGPQGSSITLNISGSVIGTEEFTEDVLIPQIKEGLRLGGDIGIN